MTQAAEHILPDEGRLLSPAEFAEIAGLREAEVQELIGYGLVGEGDLRLDARGALLLRQAVRLRADFDLDLFSTGLVARFMDRIESLESQLREARARLGADRGWTEVSFTSVQIRGARLQ
jgi:hypothetical protein